MHRRFQLSAFSILLLLCCSIKLEMLHVQSLTTFSRANLGKAGRHPETKIGPLMRLPFFYGWLIVAVTFVTMPIGGNARTAFSLFYPPIISEFGWDRGVTAGAFSFGFVASAIASPLSGRLMDRAGPRGVMELGVALMGGGLLLAQLTTQP